MAKLTESEVRAIIASRLTETLNSTDSELRSDREDALNFYYGRPMGNEIEGRAQVVSKDMMDTVEWMMPSLMRVLITQQAVQFDPVGPEDEVQAKQETGYVSHVIWKKNTGFMTLYEWIKDALIQKVGYVKYWWEEEEKTQLEEFSGLTEEQAVMTMQSLEDRGEVEVLGQEVTEEGVAFRARVKSKYGCAKFQCAPPEEVVVDKACRGNIKKARFVGHLRKNVTRSELIEEGYPRKRIEELTSYNWNADMAESLARDTVNESHTGEKRDADTASEELQLLECWTYLDADDDGKAELRHYLMGGNDELEDEEAPEIPWESWTPIPVPHRHVGLGMYDIMEDLQRIKTALQRGLLDNVYFTMNPRQAYDKNTVDVSTLQINRPGGHIAVDGAPGMSLMPIQYTPMAGQLLPVIGYFDETKETRTGVGRMSVGIDADVLAQSTKGAYMDAKGAANQRIEAIARIFAETGLSSFYNSFHGLLRRHQDWPTKFKLRNDWVETNPADWQDRTDLTVAIGLGNANKDEIRQNIMVMAQGQEKAASVPGLIQPQNVFALFRRMQTELGFENEQFITDPGSDEYKKFMANQQPPADPYLQGEQIKAQSRMQEKQLDVGIKREALAQERDLTITELELKTGVDLAKAGMGAEVAVHGANTRAATATSRGSGAATGQPAPPGEPASAGNGLAQPDQGGPFG